MGENEEPIWKKLVNVSINLFDTEFERKFTLTSCTLYSRIILSKHTHTNKHNRYIRKNRTPMSQAVYQDVDMDVRIVGKLFRKLSSQRYFIARLRRSVLH